MSEHPLSQLFLSERYLHELQRILREKLPKADVWAYGSRVRGGAHEASDLDLVARFPEHLSEEMPGVSQALDALVESRIPIQIQLLDWANAPEAFRKEIERAYVVIQRGHNG